MPRGALPPKRCSRIGARRGPAQAIGARAGGSGRHAQAARASTPTARTAHRRAVEIIPEPKVHNALAAVPALPRLTKKMAPRQAARVIKQAVSDHVLIMLMPLATIPWKLHDFTSIHVF